MTLEQVKRLQWASLIFAGGAAVFGGINSRAWGWAILGAVMTAVGIYQLLTVGTSDTAMILKRGAIRAKFYSPVVSSGTLHVAAAGIGFIFFSLKDWKASTVPIERIDYQILWAGTLYFSVNAGLAFLNKDKAKFDADKEQRNEKIKTETEFLRQQVQQSK